MAKRDGVPLDKLPKPEVTAERTRQIVLVFETNGPAPLMDCDEEVLIDALSDELAEFSFVLEEQEYHMDYENLTHVIVRDLVEGEMETYSARMIHNIDAEEPEAVSSTPTNANSTLTP